MSGLNPKPTFCSQSSEAKVVGDNIAQSLTTITALLRITEIEHSRRREGFSEILLTPLIREIGDLYDPIAEDKGVTLRVETPEGLCDGDETRHALLYQ
jgi:signal transduction histidine kinase